MTTQSAISRVRWVSIILVIALVIAFVELRSGIGRESTGQGSETPTADFLDATLEANLRLLRLDGTVIAVQTASANQPTPRPLEQGGVPITTAATAEALAKNHLPAHATVTAVSVSRLDPAVLRAWIFGGSPAQHVSGAENSGDGSSWVVAFLLGGVTFEEIMGDPPVASISQPIDGAYYAFDANQGTNNWFGAVTPGKDPFFAQLAAQPTSSSPIVTASPEPTMSYLPTPTSSTP